MSKSKVIIINVKIMNSLKQMHTWDKQMAPANELY